MIKRCCAILSTTQPAPLIGSTRLGLSWTNWRFPVGCRSSARIGHTMVQRLAVISLMGSWKKSKKKRFRCLWTRMLPSWMKQMVKSAGSPSRSIKTRRKKSQPRPWLWPLAVSGQVSKWSRNIALIWLITSPLTKLAQPVMASRWSRKSAAMRSTWIRSKFTQPLTKASIFSLGKRLAVKAAF